jgi:Na+/H+-dicarboxylate symporter
MTLTHKILLAMVLGIALGIGFNLTLGLGGELPPEGSVALWIQDTLINSALDAGGKIFIASLTLLVVPLVFVSLVCGSAALGGHSRMGPMAAKTVGLYMLTTALAISLALLIGSLFQPGSGIEAEAIEVELRAAPSAWETIINIFPSNPLRAMVEANMLQVIVFAILFGLAIARSDSSGARAIQQFFEDLNAVILKMVLMLMQLAPYGVFCLLVKLFSTMGFEAIAPLVKYFFTVLLVLALHGLGVYSLMLKVLSGLNPLIFLRKMWPVMVFGFSTASSNATLPITLRTVEKDLGVDNKVASFSVPLGATINMDGTAIMQGVATVFIAQVYQIDIGLTGYLMVILTATLASIGTAGVPGVGLITLAMVLTQAGLPVEGVALIIGVDRLLDMVRTAVNITGDAMVSTVVAKSEGLFNEERFNARESGLELTNSSEDSSTT